MHVLLRQLGRHRGAPRLYLDTPALASAGLLPGSTLATELCAAEFRLTLRLNPAGSRRVSRKRRGAREVPVLDINTSADLAPFEAFGETALLRIIIVCGAVHVLLPASTAAGWARLARLTTKIALGQRVTAAGLAFGAGIASKALHDGLAEVGVHTELRLANEICEPYIDLATMAHPMVRADTMVAALPMQELALDEWLLRRLGSVDILEAGIPCSGASKAGRAKRALTRMEDHPNVGHLMGAALQLIARLQPAVVLIENVESYRHTASAAILRGWLRDAGYAITEAVLDAADFGSLEARVRWFLVASPPQLQFSLDLLAPRDPPMAAGVLADVLDPIGPDDERFREVDYLKAKAERDADAGSGFAMQFLQPEDTRVPTLRKGYHKGGSTDPRLLHPSDPTRSRLLTGAEHARIKGVDPSLLAGASDTVMHQVCGQSVDTRVVRAIARHLGLALRQLARITPATSVASTRRHGIAEISG